MPFNLLFKNFNPKRGFFFFFVFNFLGWGFALPYFTELKTSSIVTHILFYIRLRKKNMLLHRKTPPSGRRSPTSERMKKGATWDWWNLVDFLISHHLCHLRTMVQHSSQTLTVRHGILCMSLPSLSPHVRSVLSLSCFGNMPRLTAYKDVTFIAV